MKQLLDPINYMDELIAYFKIYKDYPFYLKIIKRKYTHPHDYGDGCYDILPIFKTIGYWDPYREDFTDAEIEEWNKLATKTIEKYFKMKAFT